MPLDKNQGQNPNQKPSGFQPKSNGANESPNVKAQSFDDDAAKLAQQAGSSVAADQSSNFAIGYLRGAAGVAEYEAGVNACWTDYLSNEIPDDPMRAQMQAKMKAPGQARMQALATGVLQGGSVDVQVGKRNLTESLAILTQQKQLGAG